MAPLLKMNDHKEADGTKGMSDAKADANQVPENETKVEQPSPEIDQEVDPDADAIGDTAFSKHFLFTTLVNAIKVIEIG